MRDECSITMRTTEALNAGERGPIFRAGRRWLGGALLAVTVIVAGSGTSLVHAAETATAAMKGTIEQVLAILNAEELQGDEKKTERITRLVGVIEERFDFEEMGKRTLSKKSWAALTPEQKTEFVALFKRFLTQSYAGNVDSYAGETVEYIGERHKGSFAEVQTKIVSEKSDVPLDYRLVHKDDEWRVYDVVIDKVSLMKNYRGQFARILQSSSFDGLLEKLREKAGHVTES